MYLEMEAIFRWMIYFVVKVLLCFKAVNFPSLLFKNYRRWLVFLKTFSDRNQPVQERTIGLFLSWQGLRSLLKIIFSNSGNYN
jgi:hypothetical protein